MNKEELYMSKALEEAKKAYKKGEIPVGTIIVKDGKIISRAHNQKEEKKDPTKHAEISAILKACKKIDAWRLEGAEMYVTLEPCMMCAGAIVQSRLKKVYIGAPNKKLGYCGSVINLLDQNNEFKVESEFGILEDECSKILKDFLKELRKSSR